MARRRRVGRRESNEYQIFVISPSVKRRAFDSSLIRGSLYLSDFCVFAAGASPRPTLFAIIFNPCEAPAIFHSSLFIFHSPARALTPSVKCEAKLKELNRLHQIIKKSLSHFFTKMTGRKVKQVQHIQL